jgi:O-antigen/teichoic acid export membrane protein
MKETLNDPLTAGNALPRLVSFTKGRLTPLFYAGSSLTTMASQLVAGFLIIKWITPEDLGLWQSVRLAQIYAFLLLAGINNGLSRELPFFLGKGDYSFADRLAATAFFCVTLANSLVLFCGVGCAIAFAHRGSQLVCAILAVTFLIVLAFYQNIFIVTFRSKDSFKKLANIQLVEAGMNLATVPIVYFFHYNGMLTRTVLVTTVSCSLMFLFRPMRVKMRMDWEALKLLLKTGLPIFGLDYVKNSCGTLDRIVLLNIGGVKDVGIYQLAGMASQALGTLPGSLAAYLYPRMTYKFGQNGDARALWRSGSRFALLTVGLTALAAAGAWLILPHFVPAFVPKYLGGLRAARIVLIGGVLEGATIIVNALWSMKAWRLMVTYQISSSILAVLGPVLGVLCISRSLEGVAWGLVIGSFCRCLMALTLTYHGTHKAARVN